jgi:hypothetical protein
LTNAVQGPQSPLQTLLALGDWRGIHWRGSCFR